MISITSSLKTVYKWDSSLDTKINEKTIILFPKLILLKVDAFKLKKIKGPAKT